MGADLDGYSTFLVALPFIIETLKLLDTPHFEKYQKWNEWNIKSRRGAVNLLSIFS